MSDVEGVQVELTIEDMKVLGFALVDRARETMNDGGESCRERVKSVLRDLTKADEIFQAIELDDGGRDV